MTITLDLPPELEARLVAEANATGVPVSEVVKAYLCHSLPRHDQNATADEIDRAFEEAAGIVPPGVPPLSDKAMSRESIYTREDDWNR